MYLLTSSSRAEVMEVQILPAGLHHQEWEEMRVREEVPVRGPQVVGGQACQVPSGPGLDQPAPLCWRPGKSGLWTHSGHSMEGTRPRVKTWKDKPPWGWRGLHVAGQPDLALLPAAQPRPLTGGGRDPNPVLGPLLAIEPHREFKGRGP